MIKNIGAVDLFIVSTGHLVDAMDISFVMPTPPPPCVVRYNCYRNIGKNNGLIKFAGYIYHYKILSGNIFGLILKKKIKMATVGIFRLSARSFMTPLEQKVLQVEFSDFRICSSLQNLVLKY